MICSSFKSLVCPGVTFDPCSSRLVMPVTRSFLVLLPSVQVVWRSVTDLFMTPLFLSLGKSLSSIHVRSTDTWRGRPSGHISGQKWMFHDMSHETRAHCWKLNTPYPWRIPSGTFFFVFFFLNIDQSEFILISLKHYANMKIWFFHMVYIFLMRSACAPLRIFLVLYIFSLILFATDLLRCKSSACVYGRTQSRRDYWLYFWILNDRMQLLAHLFWLNLKCCVDFTVHQNAMF